jgi:hypothetical protein
MKNEELRMIRMQNEELRMQNDLNASFGLND